MTIPTIPEPAKATKMKPLRILSLGAGVQSSCLLLMSCHGILPKLDFAIFADTQSEPRAVYDNVEWLAAEAAHFGIKLHKVTKGSLKDDLLSGENSTGQRFASIPHYTKMPGQSSDVAGMVRRQCSNEYKIQPVERFVRRELLGLMPGQKAQADAVEMWIGFSKDELRRVRNLDTHWQRVVYPLVNLPTDYLPRAFARHDCIDWLGEIYPGREFPRSACTFCPLHDNTEWRAIRTDPAAWAEACAVDSAIRRSPKYDAECFLHRSCKPLSEANIEEWDTTGKLDFGCNGGCML